MLLVAAAAAASLLAAGAAICAVLPRVRLRQATAVNLSSTAAANALPAGGAVAVGISWAMLSRWGVGAQEFVRYTLVSGLWNVFVRLGLPMIALLVLAISGQPGEIPQAAAYCSGGALLVTVAGFCALLRSERFALLAGRMAQRVVMFGCRLTRRRPALNLPGAMLGFRAGTSALLAERGIRITVTTLIAQLSSWLVLLACLRASGLSQGQVSWQASLAAFALVRLLSMLPVTPGGLGVVELGLTGPLIAGLGGAAAARVAAAVLLYRAATYLLPVPLGALAYLWWRHARPTQLPLSSRSIPGRTASPGPGAPTAGFGEAAMQCDGAAGDGRPPAPHRCES
jgi:uncharacterized protein (TIRG00374 family)